MSVRIVTDSTADLPCDIVRKLNIEVVPLKVLFGTKEYVDGVNMDNKTFYRMLKESESLPTTAQVTPEEFTVRFQKILDKGDDIVAIFISSAMSGTSQSAHIAKQQLGADNIYIIDSQTVTFELGFLVYEAALMAQGGLRASEIAMCIERMKQKSRLLAVVDTLEYLQKGGRLKAGAAVVGTILHVKPVISIEGGLVVNLAKPRGTKKAFSQIRDFIHESGQSLDGKRIIIGNTNAPDKVREFTDYIKSIWSPSEILVFDIGTVVGTHVGEGAVGVVYLQD